MSRLLSSLFSFLFVLSESSFSFLSLLFTFVFLFALWFFSFPLRYVWSFLVPCLCLLLHGDTSLLFLYHLFHYGVPLPLRLYSAHSIFLLLFHFLFIHSSCSQLPTPFLTLKAPTLPLPFKLRDAQRPSTNPKRGIYVSRKQTHDQYNAKGKNTSRCPPHNDATR